MKIEECDLTLFYDIGEEQRATYRDDILHSHSSFQHVEHFYL